jgi:hypothetical protein
MAAAERRWPGMQTRIQRPAGAGLYLTNEVFLYRIVGIAPSETGEMVELEDCCMLDVTRVPIGHFHARRLRVVTATPDND